MKPGDKVILNKATASPGALRAFKIGTPYTITKIIYKLNSVIDIEKIQLDGSSGEWKPRSFILYNSAPEQMSLSKTQQRIHTFRSYIGFTESYMYCTVCDHKER